ncbi:unnamed protein product [Heterosigma akashiwo]
MSLWHHRLSHASEPLICQMAADDSPIVSRIIEEFNVDVAGPFSKDRSGNRWFVLFVDRKSRFRMIGLMKNKNDTFQHFLSFCQSATRSHPDISIDDVASIRMDGGDQGGEFSEIRAYAAQHGIKILPTGRSNPNGNSLAETSIEVVCQRMHASLHSSNLSDSYWSEALLHSVETTNRLPTKGLSNHISPYESWYGHRPSLRHLRSFGASCYAYLPVERRPGKLSSKGVLHKFLSYGSSTGVYRLLSPKNKVVLTKFVLFDETSVISKSSLSDDDASNHSAESSSSDGEISHHSPTSGDVFPLPQESSSNSLHSSSNSSVQSESASGSSSSSRDDSSANSLSSVNLPVPAASSPSTKGLSPSGAGRGGGSSVFRKNAGLCRRTKSACAANHERKLRRTSARFQNAKLQPISIRKLQNMSNAFAFLGTHGDSTDRPQGPDDARLLPDGIDFQQTYSPVVNAASLRLLLAISANKGYAVDSLDISTAFLNGAIDGDAYVRQPPGFVDPEHPSKVWKLNKALYGLRQSPRIWYMELHDHLLSLGFQRSGHESCLYVRREGGDELMVAVYVDNLVVSGSSPRACL